MIGEDGKVVTNASVTVDLPKELEGLVPVSDFTKQDDGRWLAHGLPIEDEFTLTIEAPGYETSLQKLGLSAGTVKELEVRLKPAATKRGDQSGKNSMEKAKGQIVFAGLCHDAQGRPIADAEVMLFLHDNKTLADEHIQAIRTDESGRFRFKPVAARRDSQTYQSYWVSVRAKGWASMVLDRSTLSSQDPHQLQITMSQSASLRGTITGPDGRPVEGAKVWTGPSRGQIDGIHTATSNAEGLFEIADLEKRDGKPVPVPQYPGAFIHMSPLLFVQHPRFAKALAPYSQVPSTVNVTLQPPAVIEGRVVYGNSNKPAPGVRLFAQPISEKTQLNLPNGEAVTDPEGRYRFGSLATGKYNIFLSAPKDDYTMAALDSFEATAGTTKTAPDLRLVHGGLIVGRVIDADTGQAIRPVAADPSWHQPDVTMSGPSRPTSGAACESAAIQEDGSFRLRAVPGHNSVQLRHSAGRPLPGVNNILLESCWETVSPGSVNLFAAEGQTVTVEFKVRKKPAKEATPPLP